MADTLAEILAAVKKAPKHRVAIDITPFLELPEGQTQEVVWDEPSVAQAHQIIPDAVELSKRFLNWPGSLAAEVATMAACHVAPQVTGGGIAVAMFYAGFATNDDNKLLWHYLSHNLRTAFPHFRLDLTGDELKKILTEPFISVPATSADGTLPNSDTCPTAS